MVDQRKASRVRRSLPVTVGAPVGGLNGRDGFADMDAQDAFVLDNFFPYNTSVDIRGGSLNYVTGMPGAVESLEVYTGAAGSKMLAFSAGGVYDATNSGVVGAALLTGRVSNRIVSAMFSNAGGQYLLMFSGSDQPLSYDGTTLAGLTITGLTGSQNNLHSAHAFKGRIFLAQTGQLGFYYLGVGAIQGVASYFDLQQVSEKGGYLVSIASYSVASMGSGPQDYAVFMTSEGEYIMYGGTDPSNASNWTLVGRYFGPAPIGRKGWFKFRSDVYVITEEGILTFAQIRQMGEDAETQRFLTSKLGRLFDDLIAYESTHGWCGLIYPRGNALVINMPTTGGEAGGYIQYVMNTNSDAWCRYTGWNGITFALLNKRLYFGTYDGRVVLADEGTSDNGADIVANCRQAWNNFDDRWDRGEMDKQFHFATFVMQADGQPPISCSINTNYEDDQPTVAGTLGSSAGGVWDLATWDVDSWAGSGTTQNFTVPIGKIGYTASVWLTLSSQGTAIRWYATRITLEKTEGIVLQ